MADAADDRRAAINRLREHLRGPMPDDLRWEVEAVLRAAEREDERKDRSWLWSAISFRTKKAGQS